MMTAVLFIAAQLMYGMVVIGFISHPAILKQTKYEVKSVLGVTSQLADDTESPPPETQPATEPQPAAPAPAEQSAPAAPEPAQEQSAPAAPEPAAPATGETTSPANSQPAAPASTESTPAPAQSPIPGATEPQPSTNESPAPAQPTVTSQPESAGESPSPTGGESEPSSPVTSPTETFVVTPSPEEAGSVSLTGTPGTPESSAVQTEAVLNPQNLINNAEHIDKASVEEITKEEDSIGKAQTTEEKTELLVTFAKDKVNDIEANIKKDDFTSTAFAAVRLTDQIDRVAAEIDQAPASQSEKIKKQISDFCRQADSKLKNQELSIPEESEQDVEIARAKCLDYQ